ncbi:YchJ family protein [Serratia sp. UGAL515B_01]|uniref:YchJ family protein n=1 Tax=Serratia sp. UGAL515B_01 TaxID=2986763 RepID=UPI0029542D35|nr:YchJ family protein [Serratia sp. UGAL515B_01]WON78577.1 YchJ family protein [Serratia sp. UGAL515B_01]
MTNLCPCGSRLSYIKCCQPYITGIEHALSPGILMRSRYTAYVKQDVDYLISTWHPDCNAEGWRDGIIGSFSNTEWLGLKVLEETAGDSCDEGFVEFIAHFNDEDTKNKVMHERSRFLRIEQRWYYIDGTRPQTGRNALCPCGSGKKYKKCCGQ